jgi:tetratricopeptide (TPR) repeat protein
MQFTRQVVVFTGALIVLLTAAPAPTQAEPPDGLIAKLPKVSNPVAHAHIVSGNAYYRAMEFEKALDEYKAGLQLEDAAIFLYNMGQCYRFLHRWDDAAWVYRRFLDRADPEQALVERVEGFIREAEARSRTEPQPRSSREPSGPVARGSDARHAPGPATASDPAKRTTWIVHGEPWYLDGVGWALVGGGIVGVGVGGWFLADAADLSNRANATTIEPERAALHYRVTNRRTLAAIVGGAGAGLLIAGVVKLVIHPEDREEPVTTSWRMSVTGNGIAVSGRF